MIVLRFIRRRLQSTNYSIVHCYPKSPCTAQLNHAFPPGAEMLSFCRSSSIGSGDFVREGGLTPRTCVVGRSTRVCCVCPDGIPHLKISRMIHDSTKTEPSVEWDADNRILTEQILTDAEKICSLLANCSPSTLNTILDQSRVKVSPDLVVEVLTRLSNAGTLALAFFRWAANQDGFKHSTEIYHQLIEALGKIKQFRLVWAVVNSMTAGGFLTKDTFMLISRRYARAKKFKDAVETFNKMEHYGLLPNVSDYNRLIDNISKSKNVKMAQMIVYDAKRRGKFMPDLKTYSILLEGWGQQLDMNKVVQVYQEMMDGGFKPDRVTYGILVNAFCKCRKIEEAVNVFHEMEARNIQPSPHSYCSIINALGANRRLEDALKYFQKANNSGLPCDLPIYNAVVGAYCWSEQYENAYSMLDEMKRCGIGPDSRTFDVILNHLIRAKKTEEAYCLFQKTESHHNCVPKINTYTMIVRMLCAESQVDLALKVWKQMNERGMLPCMHMFLVLVNRLCHDNRLEEARQFFEEMLDKGLRPPDQLYANVVQALRNGGKGEWALVLERRLYEVRHSPLAC